MKFKDVVTNIFGDHELGPMWRRLLSVCFLVMACGMGFKTYTQEIAYWFDSSITITPRLLSTLIGIFILAPLYLRNILKWKVSIYSILSFILNLFLMASFVELALGGREHSNWIYVLIGFSVVLSWLGIRGIAGIGWILTLAAGFYSIHITNTTMGIYGYLYITAGFLGLLLQTNMNPGQLVQSFKYEYSDSIRSHRNQMAADIQETKEFVSTTGNFVKENHGAEHRETDGSDADSRTEDVADEK